MLIIAGTLCYYALTNHTVAIGQHDRGDIECAKIEFLKLDEIKKPATFNERYGRWEKLPRSNSFSSLLSIR